MIYFRRENGELGAITYDSIEYDLDMINSPDALRSDIIDMIKSDNTRFSRGKKRNKYPRKDTAFMVLVK